MPNHFAVLLAASSLIPAQLPSALDTQANGKPASLYASPAVVRIVAGCSGTYSYYGSEYSLTVGEVGSGYFVDPSGYIVTNAHVLNPGEAAGCKEHLFQRFVELVTEAKEFAKVSDREKDDIRKGSKIAGKIDYVNQIVLPSGDALPFEIKQTTHSTRADGDDIAVIKVSVSNAPTLTLKNASLTEPQTSVTALGYPLNQNSTSIAAQTPVNKLPLDEPLGRAVTLNGQIAPANQNPDGGTPVFYTDARVPVGISGSPVLDSKSEVIGMMASDRAKSEQPTNPARVIASSAILESLQQAGGHNQKSATDRLYQEGLTLLTQKKFAAAKAKFQKVRELFPYHSEADWLIRESDQSSVQAQQRQKLLLLICAGAAIVGLLVLYRLFWRQRVRSNTQSQFDGLPKPMLAPEASQAPVMAGGIIESARALPKQAATTQISRNGSSSSTVISSQQFIELKNQDGQVRRFYLRRERHQVGRDRDWADLHTPDHGWEVLSRRHAVLEKEGTDYRIFDGDRQTASTNGILINGKPITPREGHLLQDGDRLETGDDPRNQVIWTYSNPSRRQTNHFPSETTVNDAKA